MTVLAHLQDAVRDGSAVPAVPLGFFGDFHIAFGTGFKIIRHRRTRKCGIPPLETAHTALRLSGDLRYFFEYIPLTVQLHHAERAWA